MGKSILIRCGKLYDGIHNELQENMEILVQGKYIAAVGKNLSRPADAEIVDLSDATVTPGMIDAHVHPDFMDSESFFQEALYASDNWKTLATLRCAQKALKRGFTTLRTLGSFSTYSYVCVDVKRAIDEGYFPGARLVVSQGCATSGSHGDFTQHLRNKFDLADYLEERSISIGNGPDFFRKLVRKQKKYGCDFIKIIATGGFATPHDSPEEQHFSDEELKAIIETAKEVGLTVTAHAYTGELITKLVNMGIDGIEHGALIDEKTARLMEQKNVYLVPTFCPYDEVINLDEEKLAKKPVEFQAKLRKYSEQLKESRKIIINSKIKLGYGTDFVAVHNNYECGYEYSAWLRSGVDPFRALKAATSINAEILQLEDKIGTIEPNKYADIAAWKRDLLTDHRALLDCCFVMKEGVIYDTEKVE